MSTWTEKYRNWAEPAALARERERQPVVVDGVEFVGVRDAVAGLPLSPQWLSRMASRVRGDNVLLVTREGVRFVRLPRHRGDERAVVYYDRESVERYCDSRMTVNNANCHKESSNG